MSASRPKPMTGPYTDGLRRKITTKERNAQVFIDYLSDFNTWFPF